MIEKRRSWGAEQRLEFIEFQLCWEGGVNRADIVRRFGVSVPQASMDLAAYREAAPHNLVYDSTAKRYVAPRNFEPLYRANPDRYLAQLRAVADGILRTEDTWIAALPPTHVIPAPARRVDVGVLRTLLGAIREQKTIEIHYQSMTRPDPIWRSISPHALGFDGQRWHARAYCHISNEFKDFVIARCLATGSTTPSSANKSEDRFWEKSFDVLLEANPDLTEGQRRAVGLEYGMENGRINLSVRYAMLFYLRWQLRLDLKVPPTRAIERPVVVANRDAFETAIAEMSAGGKAAVVQRE